MLVIQNHRPGCSLRIRELALYPPNSPGDFPLVTDLTVNLDTDRDGLSDLLEHAFQSAPGFPNSNPFRVRSANPGTVTLEFPWNWQATGLSWRIRHGDNLSNMAAWHVVAPGSVTSTREGNIDSITVTPTMAYPGRGFYILEVIETEGGFGEGSVNGVVVVGML